MGNKSLSKNLELYQSFKELDFLHSAPQQSALITDFDGTLSTLVDAPTKATLRDEVKDPLEIIASHLSLFAIISGRPVQFLEHTFSAFPTTPLVGLYGFERHMPGKASFYIKGVTPYLSCIQEAADRAQARAPEDVYVEPKGAALTLHWRSDKSQDWVEYYADEAHQRFGLRIVPSRASLELHPPIAMDKGRALMELTKTIHNICYIGDDVGDISAFKYVKFERQSGSHITVAVNTGPQELLDLADVVVNGVTGVITLLGGLAAKLTGN